MNTQLEPNEDYTGARQEDTASGGFYGICDYCNFYVSSRPDYLEVKRLCDEHNAKNPGHTAAPINN